MSKTALLIDGENLRHYIENVLIKSGRKKEYININNLNLSNLFDQVLKGIDISQKYYYSARLRFNEETPKKSAELIQKQRTLKTNLEKNGFLFIMAGTVRGQKVNGKTIFKEKGVDVRIAVDLVASACDKAYSQIILCSSDSDLQPAVKEAKNRKIQIVYLGFEINPNKGLTYTTDRTILIRDSEIVDNYNQ